MGDNRGSRLTSHGGWPGWSGAMQGFVYMPPCVCMKGLSREAGSTSFYKIFDKMFDFER